MCVCNNITRQATVLALTYLGPSELGHNVCCNWPLNKYRKNVNKSNRQRKTYTRVHIIHIKQGNQRWQIPRPPHASAWQL